MEVLLIRHAEARALGESAAHDRDGARALTARGARRFERTSDMLIERGLAPELVIHSPLLRAVETADILVRACGASSRVTTWLARPPAAPLLALLARERVALVGHEPWMSELLALCLHGDARISAGIRFAKGSCAHLEGEPRFGALRLVALFSSD